MKLSNKKKQELAGEIIERLKKEYPDAACSLDYDQAWKLLVLGIVRRETSAPV